MSRARQAQASSPPAIPGQGGTQPPPPGMEMEMDGPPSGGTPMGSGSSNIADSFTLLQLKHKEIVCEHLEVEMLTKKGIVLQYLNNNASGSTTMVGVTRIGLVDPRRMPAYVARNHAIIRQHAVAALQRHFKLTLCSTGVMEVLSPEDYSITYSWASLSEVGKSLTQHGKPDLGLGYAVCDQLLQPILVSRNDPHPVCVLNVFVQLHDATRRSTAIIKKAREEEAAKVQSQASPPKKVYVQRGPFPGPQQKKELLSEFVKDASAAFNEAIKRSAPISFDAKDFPALQGGAGPAPVWNHSGVTGLPND